MTNPTNPGPLPASNASIEDRLARIEQLLREIPRKTLYSASIGAGGLTISDDGTLRMVDVNGIERFKIGTTSGFEGFEQPVLYVRDANGKLRIAMYDPLPVSDGYQPVFWVFDHVDHVAFTTDKNGGVAEPWIPAVLYPRWTMAAGIYGYRTIDATTITAETQLWEGRLGKVSHPRIQIDGSWGQASGSNSTTYRLKVNGTTVGSWTVGGGLNVSVRGPYDIASLVGTSNVVVELTVQATGTGLVACDVVACYLRQT